MKPTIVYPDFDKLDLRVGLVVAASAPEWSEKLLELEVDFGPEIGTKTILSGIRAWYQPTEVIGNKYAFVVNLAERKMGESVSQGMMIMADSDERPFLTPLPAECEPGWIIH